MRLLAILVLSAVTAAPSLAQGSGETVTARRNGFGLVGHDDPSPRFDKWFNVPFVTGAEFTVVRAYNGSMDVSDGRREFRVTTSAFRLPDGERARQTPLAGGSASPRTTAPRRTTTRTYHRGPRGGCYYINSSGNREYVDRSFCG